MKKHTIAAAHAPAALTARLDRLPSSRYLWKIILLLSLGGCFEFYELFFTAYIAPGLLRSGLFSATTVNLFGFTGFASFVAALFAGLFVGTLVFGSLADRFGRRSIFVYSLLWYTLCTVIMAFQNSAVMIDLWRFLGAIGIGVELVTINSYISELVPKHLRGRAYAFNGAISLSVVPVVALLSWLLVPETPLGLDGWRWVMLISSVGAVAIWWLRLGIPESPRWLLQHGRAKEAEAIVAQIEAGVAAEFGGKLPPVGPAIQEESSPGRWSEMWLPQYRRRTILMALFNVLQAIGYYGFANWAPTLLIAKGITITTSLKYAFIIAVANPIGPLLFMRLADQMERKWQIVLAALGIAVFGLAFAFSTSDTMVVTFGVLVTLASNWMAFAYNTYQAELFPTRIRARALGFVNSWGRLSAMFSSFIIAFLLSEFGASGVFVFIASCMTVEILLIVGFGPLTRDRALEEIN